MGIQYEVNLSGVRSVISRQQGLSTKIAIANLSVLQDQTVLRMTMPSVALVGINSKLSEIRRQLEAESQSARKMNKALQEIVGLYETAERQAMDVQKELLSEQTDQSIWPEWICDFMNKLSDKVNKEDSTVLDALKLLANLLQQEKLTSDGACGVTGKLLRLFSSFLELASSKPQEQFGNIAGFVSDTFGLLEKVFKTMGEASKTIAGKLELTQFGAVTGTISSMVGLVENLSGVVEKWSSTTGDVVDRFASGTKQLISSFGSVVSAVVSGNGMKQILDAAKTGSMAAVGQAQKVLKSTKSWIPLISSAFSMVGSGVESLIQLGADGQITAQEAGEAVFTSCIHGLDTLASKFSHGLISFKTVFGKNVDEVVEDSRSWGTDFGTNAGFYIAQDPERLKAYNEAGLFKKTAMTMEALIKGNMEEYRTVVPGENVEPSEGIWMKALLEAIEKVPLMNPIML